MYQAAFGASPPTGFASQVSVSRVISLDGTQAIWLLESPEPLRLSATVATVGSGNRKVMLAVGPSFGSPDQGQTVAWASEVAVTPSAEMLLVQTPTLTYVGPRQPAAAAPGVSLSIAVPAGSAVAATVVVADGASLSFGAASGNPPIPPLIQGPTTNAAGDLTANPAQLSLAAVTGPVILAGTGAFGLAGLALTTAYVPAVSQENLRILAMKLPSSATDNAYAVDLGGLEAVDLTGWSIVWWDLFSPADEPGTLVTFTAAAGTLPEGSQWRSYPALSTPPADTDVDQILTGGAGTPPPPTGALLQLLDPMGNVAQEWVAAPATGQQLLAVPSADGTRAFLAPAAGASPNLLASAGSFLLEFTMDLASPGLPPWSIGGDSSPETAGLSVTF
jgi:hypothetical protein